MDKYMIVLQISAILFICFIIYFLFKFINTLIKKNRLSYFSLDINKEKYNEDKVVTRIVYKFSDILESLIIFNGLAKTYEKYVYYDNRYRKGIDFVSTKILSGFVLIVLYLFVSFLYRDTISSLMILIVFILGFILIDFYCLFIRRRANEDISVAIIPAFYALFNSLKANKTVEQSLFDIIERNEGIIKKEFKRVLNDTKMGVSLGDSFKKMYERTNIELILYISNLLILSNNSNIAINNIFDLVEEKLMKQEKINNKKNVLSSINKVSCVIFSLLPAIFLVTIVMFNVSYREIIVGSNGIFILVMITILYILYIIIINYIVRRSNYDK